MGPYYDRDRYDDDDGPDPDYFPEPDLSPEHLSELKQDERAEREFGDDLPDCDF